MNKKISTRISAVLTTLILVVSATTPVYASEDLDIQDLNPQDLNIPALTAVVNDGLLTVNAVDDASGITAIYVNGYEFTELDNGSLTKRMQQFDTGYQYFTMQAKDGAGNMSEVYRVNNPYYTFPEEDNGEAVEEPSLSHDAKPTKPSNAEADVKEHIKTDKDGNKKERTTSSTSITKSSSSGKKSSSGSITGSSSEKYADDERDKDTVSTTEGREFYTIMAKSGKIFYLVVDRNGEQETVHFLTDITENDLLNVTEDNKPTLPQNSAVVIKDAGLADMSAGAGRDGAMKPEKEESEGEGEAQETISSDSLLIDDSPTLPAGDDQVSDNTAKKKGNFITNNLLLIIIVVVVIVFFIIATLLKKRGADENYEEDEERGYDDEDYPTDHEEETEEPEDNNAFMDRPDDDNADNTGSNKQEEPIKRPEQKEESNKETQEEVKEESVTEEKTDEAQEERKTEQPIQPESQQTNEEQKSKTELPEQEEPENKNPEEEPSEDLQVSDRTVTDPDGMYTAKSCIKSSTLKNTESTIYI